MRFHVWVQARSSATCLNEHAPRDTTRKRDSAGMPKPSNGQWHRTEPCLPSQKTRQLRLKPRKQVQVREELRLSKQTLPRKSLSGSRYWWQLPGAWSLFRLKPTLPPCFAFQKDSSPGLGTPALALPLRYSLAAPAWARLPRCVLASSCSRCALEALSSNP